MNAFDGRYRLNIRVGDLVEIIKKNHQQTGELTEGAVKKILTKSKFHPHGIKVIIDTNEVGRVKNILKED
ncbi:MAG TPA: YwbE family protein [Crocinitomix sp.]|nr:YwbE family protein [Crocinitomix sp.]